MSEYILAENKDILKIWQTISDLKDIIEKNAENIEKLEKKINHHFSLS
jgi:hypothetical protein